MFDGTNCTDEINFGRYITEFECQGLHENNEILKDARLSFPSGHSSFSFFTMVYLTVSVSFSFPSIKVSFYNKRLNLLRYFCSSSLLLNWFSCICNRAWPGAVQDYYVTFCSLPLLCWPGTRPCLVSRTTNTTGRMYWREPWSAPCQPSSWYVQHANLLPHKFKYLPSKLRLAQLFRLSITFVSRFVYYHYNIYVCMYVSVLFVCECASFTFCVCVCFVSVLLDRIKNYGVLLLLFFSRIVIIWINGLFGAPLLAPFFIKTNKSLAPNKLPIHFSVMDKS